MKLKSPNILAIETLWFPNTIHPRESVKPVLDLVYNENKIDFSLFTANTREELRFVLTKLKQSNAGILYLCSHGRSNTFSFGYGNSDTMTMGELAEILKGKLVGVGIHVSSCLFLDVDDDIVNNFLSVTKTPFISGYMRTVDWLESSCLDALLLSTLQQSKEDVLTTIKRFNNKYQQLSNKLGFNAYISGVEPIKEIKKAKVK